MAVPLFCPTTVGNSGQHRPPRSRSPKCLIQPCHVDRGGQSRADPSTHVCLGRRPPHLPPWFSRLRLGSKNNAMVPNRHTRLSTSPTSPVHDRTLTAKGWDGRDPRGGRGAAAATPQPLAWQGYQLSHKHWPATQSCRKTLKLLPLGISCLIPTTVQTVNGVLETHFLPVDPIDATCNLDVSQQRQQIRRVSNAQSKPPSPPTPPAARCAPPTAWPARRRPPIGRSALLNIWRRRRRAAAQLASPTQH